MPYVISAMKNKNNFARFIPGRTDPNSRMSFSADKKTVSFSNANYEVSAFTDVLKRTGKHWCEFITDPTDFDTGYIYLGLTLDYSPEPNTAINASFTLYIRPNTNSVGIFNGSSSIAAPGIVFTKGDVFGFGYDFDAGTLIVHHNGSEIYSGNVALGTAPNGDIGWRRPYVGAGIHAPNTVASKVSIRSKAPWVHGPPDGSWSGWVDDTVGKQQITSPAVWLKGGEAPVSLWAKALDNADFDTLRSLEFMVRLSTANFSYDGAQRRFLASKCYIDGTGHYTSQAGGSRTIIDSRLQPNSGASAYMQTLKLYDGLWHRVSLVGDWAAAKGRLYIDGVLRGESDLGGTGPVANTRHLYLLSATGDENGYNISDAEVCDLRIWNDARTAQEVLDYMNYKAITGAEAGLIGLWYGDEGTGTTLDDETAYNHDLIASNAAIWAS